MPFFLYCLLVYCVISVSSISSSQSDDISTRFKRRNNKHVLESHLIDEYAEDLGAEDESDQVDSSNESGQRRIISLESEEGDLFEVDRQLQLDEAHKVALRFGRRISGAAAHRAISKKKKTGKSRDKGKSKRKAGAVTFRPARSAIDHTTPASPAISKQSNVIQVFGIKINRPAASQLLAGKSAEKKKNGSSKKKSIGSDGKEIYEALHVNMTGKQCPPLFMASNGSMTSHCSNYKFIKKHFAMEMDSREPLTSDRIEVQSCMRMVHCKETSMFVK
ncbi:hypothetical protein WR25_05918 [Diploscapter pachys]|uniref:Uncharacterized protein n=1 Tax=Diploscapter pachys TaxID=2018661 RepID=A0A2A2KVF0_9BILA|nr:hypothetical protein WR25_05918 [Diploscapter pachys]